MSTPEWRGACRLAAAEVAKLTKRLDRTAQEGLVVNREQRKALGELQDLLAALQYATPEEWAQVRMDAGVMDMFGRRLSAERAAAGGTG